MRVLRYPGMRVELADQLAVLGDPQDHERFWADEDPSGLHDVIELLYESFQVLPDPEVQVGWSVEPGDVGVLRRLGEVLTPLVDRLGAAPATAYRADPAWEEVTRRAAEAARVLAEGDGSKG